MTNQVLTDDAVARCHEQGHEFRWVPLSSFTGGMGQPTCTTCGLVLRECRLAELGQARARLMDRMSRKPLEVRPAGAAAGEESDAPRRRKKRKAVNVDRDAQIVELAAGGMTHPQLAERFGIHRNRVYQILRKAREAATTP